MNLREFLIQAQVDLNSYHFHKEEAIQVEMPDESYRNIKEIFFIADRTIIRLEEARDVSS